MNKKKEIELLLGWLANIPMRTRHVVACYNVDLYKQLLQIESQCLTLAAGITGSHLIPNGVHLLMSVEDLANVLRRNPEFADNCAAALVMTRSLPIQTDNSEK